MSATYLLFSCNLIVVVVVSVYHYYYKSMANNTTLDLTCYFCSIYLNFILEDNNIIYDL